MPAAQAWTRLKANSEIPALGCIDRMLDFVARHPAAIAKPTQSFVPNIPERATPGSAGRSSAGRGGRYGGDEHSDQLRHERRFQLGPQPNEWPVFEAVLQRASDYPCPDAQALPDVACVALNRMGSRYILHAVDLTFHLTDKERAAMTSMTR